MSQTLSNISQFPTKFVVPTITLITTNSILLKILKESTSEEVWHWLIKVTRNATYFGIVTFFSLQTVYTYCKRLFVTKMWKNTYNNKDAYFLPKFWRLQTTTLYKRIYFSLYFLLIINFKSRSQTSWQVTHSEFVSRCRTWQFLMTCC